jgi:NADH-quinone oxidoreductase subunit M
MLPMAVVLAAWGALVIAAIYMLRGVREVLHGPLAARWNHVQDVPGWWAKLPYTLLVAALLVFGFYPPLLTRPIEPAVTALVQKAGYDVPLPGKAKARAGKEKPAAAAPVLRL